MPTAKVATTSNNNTKAIIITLLILSTGIISAVLFILFNQSQAPAKKAAGPSCPIDSAYCQWEGQEGVSYHYEIIDITQVNKIIKSGDITNVGKNKIAFTPESGGKYRCTVTAKNVCGETTVSDETKCGAPSPSPTIPLPDLKQPTATPGLTKTVTPGAPTATSIPGAPTPTGVPGAPTNTPVPTITTSTATTRIVTPTPTSIVVAQSTNVPTATSIPANSSSSSSTTTTTTLPQSGSILPSLAAFGLAAAVIIVGLVL